ncbi:MAG: MOSC N-terminal beta barrel domain-containing protein [Lysobacterales bacterium]|jgi:uncharacterized protein YcbX
MDQACVREINVYPVKSMKGISLAQGELTAKGLQYDRHWMVVRHNGRFVTQREQPALARIGTELDARGLTLSREGIGSVFLPFEAEAGEEIVSRVWKDDCRTLDEGPEVSRWITAALESEEPFRLVRMAPGFRRELPADRFGKESTTVFADAAPYLVASEASLEYVNRELRARGLQPVPMNRFRPNIVLGGVDAFAEHSSRELYGEHWRIKLIDPSQRCLVTTVDQATGHRDPNRQPYLAMREISPAAGPGSAPAFGQNAVLAAGEGQFIRAGESIALS